MTPAPDDDADRARNSSKPSGASLSNLDIPIAKVFQPLLEPARYKGAHGGRGSGKSHFFGGLLVDVQFRQMFLRAQR